MAKRTLTEGRVIDGRLFQAGDSPDLKAAQEKELAALGILEPKQDAKAKDGEGSGEGDKE